MKHLYKGFKKVEEDDKSAKLVHEKGHELVISKKGLNKHLLSGLEELPLHQFDGTNPPPSESYSVGDIKISPEDVQKLQSYTQDQEQPKTERQVATEPVSQKPSVEELQQQQNQALEELKQAPEQYRAPTYQEIISDPNVADSKKLLAANQWFLDTQRKQQEADNLFQTEMRKMPQKIPSYLSGSGFLGGLAKVLGFVIGGGGQGVLGLKENPALTLYNEQINREIDAQRYERGEKFNLYKLHMNRLGNDQAASLQTAINLRQIADHQFNVMMGKTGIGPQAIQNLQLMKAQNDLALQQTQQSLSNIKFQKQFKENLYKQVLQSTTPFQQAPSEELSSLDPAYLVPHLVPKEEQESVNKEIERAQDTKRMANNIMKAFEQAAKEQTIMKTGAGFLRTSAGVKALHQAMQPTFKDLEGTVRQAAMDNTFSNITPASGDFDETINTKRNALIDYLQSKASAPRAKQYGIDLSKFRSTAPLRRKN